VIADPPVAGMVKFTSRAWFCGVIDVIVGADGAAGVVNDVVAGWLSPLPLTASSCKLYAVPFASPVSWVGLVVEIEVHDEPPLML
jgi:hypothetical protein